MSSTFELSICCIAVSPFIFPVWLAVLLLPLFIMTLHTDKVCQIVKNITEQYNH